MLTDGALCVADFLLSDFGRSILLAGASVLSLLGLTAGRLSVGRVDFSVLTFFSRDGVLRTRSSEERDSVLLGLVASLRGSACLSTSRVSTFLPGLADSVRLRVPSVTCLDPLLLSEPRLTVAGLLSLPDLTVRVFASAAGREPCLPSELFTELLAGGRLLPVERRCA